MKKKIKIKNEIDIIIARQVGGNIADELGFDITEQHCIITSVSELATNIFLYAGKGVIKFNIVKNENNNIGIEVIAKDRGKGIENIDLAMQDGYSTHNGLGGGLPGVKRLMSDMVINSKAEIGTEVRAIKWLNEDDIKNPVLPIEYIKKLKLNKEE